MLFLACNNAERRVSFAQAGEAIRKLDARLQKIEANNANPVAQRQQAKPRAVFMGPNGQEFDNPNDAFNANQRQNKIDDLQRQMDIIEFNQMSGGPPLLIP